MRKVFFTAIIIIILCMPTFADEVLLKNGNTITGKIVSENEDLVKLQIEDAGRITIKRKDVDKIIYKKSGGSGDTKRPPLDVNKKSPARTTTSKKKGKDKRFSWRDFVIAFMISLVFGALCLWISLGIVDRGNPKNKFAAALGWTLVLAGASLFPFPFGLVLLLFVFILICLHYYDLGFTKAFLAFILQFAVWLALGLYATVITALIKEAIEKL